MTARRRQSSGRLLVDNQSVNLIVEHQQVELIVEQKQVELSLGEIGPQGIPGPKGDTGNIGPTGPQGPPGEPETISFVYLQAISSDEWEIDHNLTWYPNVTVVDSAGSVVEGEIEYVNENRLILRFSSEFSGKAYLS